MKPVPERMVTHLGTCKGCGKLAKRLVPESTTQHFLCAKCDVPRWGLAEMQDWQNKEIARLLCA